MTTMTRITNKGSRAQAVPTVGGSITVRPGRTVETAETLRIDDDMIEHFRARGVTFSAAGKANKADKGAAARAKAEKALAEAEAARAAAGDDEALKAKAEADLDTARAALAALKD